MPDCLLSLQLLTAVFILLILQPLKRLWGKHVIFMGPSPEVQMVRNHRNAREAETEGQSLIPGSGRYPGEGSGNPLQYFCLENPMDRGAW